MTDADSRLSALILRAREARDLEYKGGGGRLPFAWGPYAVNAAIARTAMAMANIGGGSIVVGMDQVEPDRWQPNGVDEAVDATFQQDRVQQFVNQHADPYVELTVDHLHHDAKRFVIIEVTGFRESPVICTSGSDPLRPGAVYTRSFEKPETRVVQSHLEMRELLDRAIAVGIQQSLRPVFEALKEAGLGGGAIRSDEERFRSQRGDL
jgi:predicted HTH transcriptional regulator